MKIYGFLNTLALSLVISVATAINSSAQSLTTVYNFCSQSSCNDGSYPLGLLVQANDGNFYGTTFVSGSNGWGTVYKISPSGSFNVLWNLTGLSDGAQPYAGVVQGHDGNFYGVDTIGGNTPSGCGAAFKVSSSGQETSLHAFTGYPHDGCNPWSPLLLANDGNFYGTAPYGGSANVGVIFKMTPSGSVSILYNFCTQANCPDGAYPSAGLIQASDGYLYGEATTNGANGYGTIFKLSLSGSGFTVVHNFTSSDGYLATGGMVQTSDGNLYGTTNAGGANNFGTVFKMTPSGTLTTLYSFCSKPFCADGSAPYAGLTQGGDGNLYGTTYEGGNFVQGSTYGTIFGITPGGSLSTLYSFCAQANCTDGGYPYAGVTQGSDGNLYGVTKVGGTNNAGTVFKLTMNTDTLTVSTVGAGTVTSTDGFINCPGTCSHIYQHNAQVTLTATAAAGWAFSAWGGACSGSNPSCTFTMPQNQAVTGTFTQLSYTLSVSTTGQGSVTSSDGNINCPGTCTHTYLSSTVVPLTANPAQGWSLNAWGGACTGNSPTCNVTMTENESASAAFTQNSYTLTVSISGQGTVTSTDGNINCPGTCTHTYLSLTQVTLNASADHGWNFAGWSGACSGVGPCTLTMLGNYGVSAYLIQPGSGLEFSSVTPCRLVDTRQTGMPIQGGTSQNFIIPQLGGCGIPTGGQAYSLNVTVVPHGALGYLTVWPAGLAQPGISTMNSRDGRTKATAVIVQAGTNDAISIFASNTTDVILDVNGYFGAAGAQTYKFYRLAPCRVIDTRNPNGELGGPALLGAQQRDFAVETSPCMPQGTTIQAYSFNFTVVPHPYGQPLRYLTVWPQGQSQPVVSTLNNRTATTLANAAIVPAGTNGGISVYASDSTQLVVDINGYFAAPATGGLTLYPTAPCRVLDTRSNHGQPFQGEKTVDVVDSVCAPPTDTQAYVFNATVVPSGPMHYLTLWPDPGQAPLASTLNAIDGLITSNMAIVPNSDGSTDAFASELTHLIIDISSYFAP